MWYYDGLQNGYKGKVVNFSYNNKEGPRSGNIPEYIDVQFCELYDYFETFILETNQTVSTSVVSAEWKIPSGHNVTFVC